MYHTDEHLPSHKHRYKSSSNEGTEKGKGAGFTGQRYSDLWKTKGVVLILEWSFL